MNRSEWEEFICSPQHAGRHLSSIGRGVAGGTATAVDLPTLRAFLDKLSEDRRDVEVLANVVDLLTAPYLSFVRRELPRLLDHLSNEVLSPEETSGPKLRGNPRWDKTYLGRLNGTVPRLKFVTRSAHRSFELPENSLLRWLLEELRNAIIGIERRCGSAALHPDLREIGRAVDHALRHHWLRAVRVPPRIEHPMLAAALRHRNPGYRLAADLARLRAAFANRNPDRRWGSIVSLLAVNYLRPINDDDLFELYVLVMVLDVLTGELGLPEPDEIGLVVPGRSHVASYRLNDGRLLVYFDQSPERVTGHTSEYVRVIRAHEGVTGSARRPDLILAVDRNGERELLIIEAKRSEDGPYLSDSIYKIFGYLFDIFRAEVPVASQPKAILISPARIRPTVTDRRGLGVAICGDGDRALLAQLIRESILSPYQPGC